MTQPLETPLPQREDGDEGMKVAAHGAATTGQGTVASAATIEAPRSGATMLSATQLKTLNDEDCRRRDRGLAAIRNIFNATGAREIVEGNVAIGLHLMGGCNLGTDPAKSVTGPDFRLHRFANCYAADSSTFPNAPGINPSFTIMAIASKAADRILEDAR